MDKTVITVAILGDSGVGKTTFLHRCHSDKFMEDVPSNVINTILISHTLHGNIEFKIVNDNQCPFDAAIVMFDVTNPSSFEYAESLIESLSLYLILTLLYY